MGALRPLREALHPLPTPSPGAWGRERVYALVRGRLSTECALRRRRYAQTVGQLRGVTEGESQWKRALTCGRAGAVQGGKAVRVAGGAKRTFIRPAYNLAKKVMPKISPTEEAALSSGTISWYIHILKSLRYSDFKQHS